MMSQKYLQSASKVAPWAALLSFGGLVWVWWTLANRNWWVFRNCMVGAVVCILRGAMVKYPALIAQLKFETDGGRPGTIGRRYSNPFCMKAGPITKRRKGEADGFAVYGSLFNAWMDRLDWDKAWELPEPTGPNEYLQTVVAAPYLGQDASADLRQNYYLSCVSIMESGAVGKGWIPALFGLVGTVALVVWGYSRWGKKGNRKSGF